MKYRICRCTFLKPRFNEDTGFLVPRSKKFYEARYSVSHKYA